jgi:hypothetical protein
MRALEIHVNGKRLCTAGIGDDGALTAIVRSVLSPVQINRRNRSPQIKEDLGLDVGGFIPSTSEHVRWKAPKLRTGDEVRIKIIETDRPDKPSRRERADPDLVIKAEKKYVERTAKRLGWKLVKAQSVRARKRSWS